MLRNVVFVQPVTMEEAQKHISDILLVTPFLKIIVYSYS
jgi:hypothetical protein